MGELRLRDLPGAALFRYVKIPNAVTGSTPSPDLMWKSYENHGPAPSPVTIWWSAEDGSKWDDHPVQDVDLTYAVQSDPRYAYCKRLLLEQVTQVKITPVQTQLHTAHVSINTQVARPGRCSDPTCVKHGMTVERGASGKCYCCGKELM